MHKAMKNLIEQVALLDLGSQLKSDPSLANALITFGSENQHQVHPLHYVCDCVFEGKIMEAEALEIAQLFIEYGADIDGEKIVAKDSPLIAASSLYCDEIALYLIDLGADIQHKGTHQGTCLHWACWTGADRVVEKLMKLEIDLEDQQNDFQASPLQWAIHGFLKGGEKNQRQQKTVIASLLQAGASTAFLNPEEVKQSEDYQAIRDLLIPYLN